MKNNSIKTVFLSLLVMALWGSLFPMVKIGYDAFSIDSASVPDVLMFAAVRFIVSGIILMIIMGFTLKKEEIPSKNTLCAILISCMFSIVLHYSFTYIGLGMTDSSKTALLKQTGPLFYSCFAFLFIKTEKFKISNFVGAIVGFFGIIAINLGTNISGLAAGDLLILLASLCTVISSIMGWYIVKKTSPICSVGISQFTGGLILFATALALGAEFPVFTLKSTLVFAYICTASILAYVLFGYTQRLSDMSKLFIIKFAEPLFACIFGAVLLGENIFKIQYLAAFVLISAGIVIGNKD